MFSEASVLFEQSTMQEDSRKAFIEWAYYKDQREELNVMDKDKWLREVWPTHKHNFYNKQSTSEKDFSNNL